MILLISFLALALQPPHQAPKADPKPAVSRPARYSIVAEDQLSISVLGFPELSSQTSVLPDGTITVPLLRDIVAQGKSPETLAQELEVKWGRLVVNPKVTVSILQRKRRFVYLDGQISHPGQVEFRPGMRILEAIALSGGFTPLADSRRVQWAGPVDSKTLDLANPEQKLNGEADVALAPEDRVYIPEAPRVNIFGRVSTPGALVYRPEMTVLDALQSAGGVKEDAELSSASVQRGETKLPLDLEALLRQGDIAKNLKLAPGDVVYVPEARNRVYVFGAVNRPGFYLVKPKDRILDVLDSAGGLTTEADAKNVRFVRSGPNREPVSKQTLNMDELFKKGDLSKNIAVQAGDVVYVSFKKKPVSWSEIFSILGSLDIIFNGGGKIIR